MSKIVSTASVCDGTEFAGSVIERADGTFEVFDVRG
jgi:hypothetical protein